ncbi:uncharacterized protein CLUP02_01054 [Colletotrichum lupini]|uniref:Uncharacterized protein n=1 Tax=Colletotrichum lupini TaxID=145971 RepID=A0A9Q8SBM6_9PEZI|nr:uncharacterized protein CLUP02_01054 [Colletotrichum lupini]UQC74404.1 hypothetical protein CLUP02_01054 [Colletotrichum lupini]
MTDHHRPTLPCQPLIFRALWSRLAVVNSTPLPDLDITLPAHRVTIFATRDGYGYIQSDNGLSGARLDNNDVMLQLIAYWLNPTHP